MKAIGGPLRRRGRRPTGQIPNVITDIALLVGDADVGVADAHVPVDLMRQSVGAGPVVRQRLPRAPLVRYRARRGADRRIGAFPNTVVAAKRTVSDISLPGVDVVSSCDSCSCSSARRVGQVLPWAPVQRADRPGGVGMGGQPDCGRCEAAGDQRPGDDPPAAVGCIHTTKFTPAGNLPIPKMRKISWLRTPAWRAAGRAARRRGRARFRRGPRRHRPRR